MTFESSTDAWCLFKVRLRILGSQLLSAKDIVMESVMILT